MLIHFKPSIKTSILLLMFIGGTKTFVSASLPRLNHVQHQFHTFGIQLNYSKFTHLFVPDSTQSSDIVINFQVNSEIHYLSLKHFKNKESENTFLQARKKEEELGNLLIQTDSLRKVYVGSTNEAKERIAVLILKNEEYSTKLNQEIPSLYQTARDNEEQYWQNQSSAERSKFQDEVKLFSDSLAISNQKKEIEMAAKIQIDTSFNSHEAESKQAKTEVPANAIVYKIQIGTFKGKVPETAAKMIKKLSMLRKIENYKDEKGYTVYTTGNLKTHQEAVTMQTQVKQEGVKNPTIIAFQKGKKITVEEAKKINKEL